MHYIFLLKDLPEPRLQSQNLDYVVLLARFVFLLFHLLQGILKVYLMVPVHILWSSRPTLDNIMQHLLLLHWVLKWIKELLLSLAHILLESVVNFTIFLALCYLLQIKNQSLLKYIFMILGNSWLKGKETTQISILL